MISRKQQTIKIEIHKTRHSDTLREMENIASNLEQLLNRATDIRNSATDTAAALEFCSVVNREPCCAHIAARVLANKIQSPEEWEALQGLNLIDTCMKQCGVIFHAEVGKFRFLNEMIKLVSPKYLGGRTAPAVRRKVLQLMHAWTVDYPRETKIRDAYDMLKKQGVIKEEPSYSSSLFNNCSGPGSPLPPPLPRRSANTIFEDEERSRLLQKLLQSKNPDDLQAANRLIKTMVKEDERRVEINSRRITELESVHNNARLLSEMLDSYRPGQSSQEELELIRELHQSCERLRPNVFHLASETQDNEAMLNEVLSASDELGQVFDKYTSVIVQGKPAYVAPKTSTTSLLDLSTPSEEKLPPVPIEILENQLTDLGFTLNMQAANKNADGKDFASTASSKQSNLEDLGDIFASIEPAKMAPPTSPVHSMLQPTTISQTNTKSATVDPLEVPEKNSKLKALEDLDVLGETMLKQSLPTSCKMGSQFAKPSGKVPMNLLGKLPVREPHGANSLAHGMGDVTTSPAAKPVPSLDLDFLIGGAVKVVSEASNSDLLNGDDSMVDLSEEGGDIYGEMSAGDGKNIPSVAPNTNVVEPPSIQSNKNSPSPEHAVKESVEVPLPKNNTNSTDVQSRSNANTPVKKLAVQPLTDISVSLDSIKPGSLPPLTAMEERNGISVILHFSSDMPRPDVSVIVVTTVSKNSSNLTNYLFQAVVPKIRANSRRKFNWMTLKPGCTVDTCKLRLLPPSATELPAHSPFLPPSAITQVMLIANPNKDLISLKFILSYTIDHETVTEMGEVEQLPLVT